MFSFLIMFLKYLVLYTAVGWLRYCKDRACFKLLELMTIPFPKWGNVVNTSTSVLITVRLSSVNLQPPVFTLPYLRAPGRMLAINRDHFFP